MTPDWLTQRLSGLTTSAWLADARQAAFGLTLWLGGIILGVLTVTVVLVYVRRRLRPTPSDEFRGFTLDDIKGMRARGKLSEKEYDALRRRVAGIESGRIADSARD